MVAGGRAIRPIVQKRLCFETEKDLMNDFISTDAFIDRLAAGLQTEISCPQIETDRTIRKYPETATE
jgi:hypothetical protein